MTPQDKIKRHGRHLMNLASVAMFAVGLFTLVMMTLPWQPESRLDPETLEWHYHLRAVAPAALDPAIKSMITIAGAMQGLVWLLPLWMLRRLGYRLNREEALSARTASAVRHLAHALMAGLGLRFLVEMLLGFTVEAATATAMGTLEYVAPFDLGSNFTTLVAGLCLYSLSHVIRLGADAADDVRSIV